MAADGVGAGGEVEGELDAVEVAEEPEGAAGIGSGIVQGMGRG